MPRNLTTSVSQQVTSLDRSTNVLVDLKDKIITTSHCQYYEYTYTGTQQFIIPVSGTIVSYFHETQQPADYSLVEVSGSDVYRGFYSKISLELLAPTAVDGIGVKIEAASGSLPGIYRAIICYSSI